MFPQEKEKYFYFPAEVFLTNYYTTRNVEQLWPKYDYCAPFNGEVQRGLVTEGFSWLDLGQKNWVEFIHTNDYGTGSMP